MVLDLLSDRFQGPFVKELTVLGVSFSTDIVQMKAIGGKKKRKKENTSSASV